MQQSIPSMNLAPSACSERNFFPFKQALILFTSVSSLALLSSCSWLGFDNPFGSTRPDQMVPGERHAPVYNTRDMQKISQNQRTAAAVPVANRTPSDYSDTAQSQVSSSAALSGNLNPAPVKADTSLTLRKPLRQNIYNTQNSAPSNSAAPPSPYQAVVPQAVPLPMEAAPVSSYAPPPQPVADAEQEPAPKPTEHAEHGSFFSRLLHGTKDSSPPPWKNRGEFESENDISEDEKTAPYAPLSSVPVRPDEFKDIKSGRDQEVQDLQSDHATAQQERQSLSAEPSQEQAVTPVEMPSANAPVMSPAPVNGYTPMNSGDTDVRRPKRGVDIMTQEEWEAFQKSRQLPQSMPQNYMSQPAKADGVGADRPSFFDQLFTPAPDTSGVKVAAPAPSETTTAEPAPDTVVTDVTPPALSQGSSAPAGDASLPSPELLDQVKTVPTNTGQ